MPPILSSPVQQPGWDVRPALKVCVTIGLTKKEMEKAGTTIKQKIAKVMTRRTTGKASSPTPS
jgi:hypothetical protein